MDLAIAVKVFFTSDQSLVNRLGEMYNNYLNLFLQFTVHVTSLPLNLIAQELKVEMISNQRAL